ncbi:MAG: sulfatase-like hydrolase/transferase [Planctomycetes bacterium]|nr:sulfatase-like hydrolase/transferase [Planctomycetota bacterium]
MWAGPAVLLAVWALVPTHPDTQQAWGALEQPGVPLSARLGAWLLQLGLLAGLSALGLALGALASFAWGGSLAIARWRPGAWVRWSLVGATVLVLDGWLVSASMIRHPHPYAFWFHERGGLLAAYQQALTTGAYRSAGVLGWGAGFLAGWLGLVFALPRGRRYGAEALARRWRGLAAVGALACVGLLLTSGRRVRPWPEATAAGSAREDERPNVLVLCVESLRADCVDPQIAPTLYALAQRGVWFRNAHVSCPRTTQGLTSLLTGRWPRSHGLRHMFPPRAQRQALGLTLPRALAASGYRTACFADDAYGPLALFDYGFASKPPELGGIASVTVRSHLLRRALPLMPLTTSGPAHDALPFLDSDWFANDPERQAQEIGDALAAWGQGSPWFAFAFFSGPHMPYAAPEPYYRRFTDPRYPGPSRYGFSWQVSDAPFDQRQIRGLYNGSVYAADRALRAVLERLEREGLERKTIVVVLGDHGELMHEANRGYGHGDHLFADAQVTTAFALYDPRSATPHSVPGIVRDIDLAPTLASLCGVELPGADGVDLGPLLRGEVADLDLPAFCESGYAWETRFMRSLEDAVPFPRYPSFLQYEDGDVCLKPELEPLARLVKHRSLCRGRYKLCYMPTLRGEQRGARWWLFDVVADPLELRDLSAELPEVRAALEAELRSWLTADGSRFEDGWVLDATSRAE